MSTRDRILVVEDEGIVAMELDDRLRAMGFDVVGVASTGETAIQLALSERPDLVLMDVRLKGDMDGPEAAALIREQLDVPFVFLTAYADDATLARVKPIEAHAYVIKPLEERSLAITIHLALHRHRAAMARGVAERAQRRTEARHAAVLDNTHDGVVCVDAEQRITVFNKGAERIFGYAAGEILGKSLDVLIPDELVREHRRHFEGFHESGITARAMGSSREVTGRRRSGEAFPAEVTVSRLEVEGEKMFTACIRDVSDRRTLEEQFTRAQKMEAVGRLAASVAHDFNNLLAAVQSNLYLVKLEAPPELREYVDEIASSVDRGVALTRQLLGFSRNQPANQRNVEANELIESSRNLLQRLVREDVRFSTHLSPTAGRVFVDRNLIEQVLMNLVVNARDAMPRGGSLSIRTFGTHISAGETFLAPGPYACIEVSDTGTGIAPEVLPRVFEPFFTTKPPGVGTGLGLSTVRSIVRRNGGEVRVSSSPGTGTTFTVLLPQVDGSPRRAEPRHKTDPAPRGTETILLVEDDPSILRGVTHILSRSGYQVLGARSCEAALELAAPSRGTIDLVLTDLVMPGCSGQELAAKILQQRPNVPIVFMTGFSEQTARTQDAFLDCHPVLEKPVAPELLLRIIRSSIDQTEPWPGVEGVR